MKQLLLSAVVAAIVSVIVILGFTSVFGYDPTEAVPVFGVTEALVEDTWVNAARTAGSDLRTLTDASTSMCYLTKIEISGVQGPDDTQACAVEIDDFTGFWQLIATVEDGGRSEIRCNARCLTWESNGTE